MSNRIDPLAPPPPSPFPPPQHSPWKAWGIRLGISLVGAVIGATCPLWPAPLLPVCVIVSKVVHASGASTPADFVPAPPPAPVPEP